ncbi:sphingolipid delta-4 desaturase [Cryptococcus gattii E566]|uniref:sphingolipid 4-desaturase n=1 Tax=Cryptococcus gattii serotype B (strain WM276 / ATCC MYA-4071) TaxID=367775 RepID=E6QY97_CRYGW|nr:Fatty acid desaturase, putative [Cryptococcus gattii WM276]ADV19889.1 Fatty acid desaturase, putative [Cryptococcus gattii WM276]KIY37217.1 sphingolipid delta-4 desaturase [Cryptococcus gattii E566]KJE03113.1 sphingolipid delta-4 desaturase [Cryptococcus gattii NT-10]
MDPVVFPEVPPHATPLSRHAPPSLTSSSPSPVLSSADPSDRELDVSEDTSSSSQTPATDESFVDPYPDFLWMTTEEPHRSRRIAILKAHPEVRKLMGPTPVTLPLVFAVLGLQLSLSLYLKSHHTLSLPVLLTAYVIGGTANQNIFLAIHEITHNLALKSIRANKCLAIIANISIGIPYAMAFKGYHIEHHKFLGEDGIDTDLPSRLEALVLNNVAGKTFFATFQLLFYAIRPGFIRAQTFTRWHFYNLVSVIGFHLLWYHFFGIRPWLYLVLSSFFAGSLHPCAAHFIAEHYLMEGHLPVGENLQGNDLIKGLSQETTSYYGWLNILCYNVGYHNEHHDFPSVPWTRLPELHRIAHEFYDPLPSHPSWPYVTWKFITDPSVGMWCRAKREGKGDRLHESVWVNGSRCVSRKSEDDMEEEDERGYASDRDEQTKKKKA